MWLILPVYNAMYCKQYISITKYCHIHNKLIESDVKKQELHIIQQKAIKWYFPSYFHCRSSLTPKNLTPEQCQQPCCWPKDSTVINEISTLHQNDRRYLKTYQVTHFESNSLYFNNFFFSYLEQYAILLHKIFDHITVTYIQQIIYNFIPFSKHWWGYIISKSH